MIQKQPPCRYCIWAFSFGRFPLKPQYNGLTCAIGQAYLLLDQRRSWWYKYIFFIKLVTTHLHCCISMCFKMILFLFSTLILMFHSSRSLCFTNHRSGTFWWTPKAEMACGLFGLFDKHMKSYFSVNSHVLKCILCFERHTLQRYVIETQFVREWCFSAKCIVHCERFCYIIAERLIA